MTPEQFCYWLQGAFETMDEGRGLSVFDHIVRDHLKEVFDKKTPERSGNSFGGLTTTPGNDWVTLPYKPLEYQKDPQKTDTWPCRVDHFIC